ncbi:MAG: acyl-CoA synthetase (NDP forming) [Paracoccaceae bacterium]|jgi:acyl-CoA synthetase (NDP forming)
MTPAKERNFERLMSPKSIAFFGGTDVEVAIKEAQRRGFTGAIWPVNPNRQEILGFKCYKSVNDLPKPPDASFIAVPSRSVTSVVKMLSDCGAGGAVCYSAGFGETGDEGQALENELNLVTGDLALIGPNCYGFINYLDNVALWPFAHGGYCPGFGAAIITQSGMLSSDITMTQRCIPLTHMISLGNQASLNMEEIIDFLSEDPRIKAIGVHIEGLKDIAKFQEVALKAIERNTPIVAFKTGSSKIGQSLTVTHTGSLSGDDKLYDALFSRTGVIRVSDPVQFLETLKFLCISGLPKNDSVVAFTCSGGGATMIADYSEKIGLNLPSFKTLAKGKLKKLLPSIATVSNPLDYTTPIWGSAEKTYPVFYEAIKASKAATAVLLQDYPALGLDESKAYYLNDAKAFIKASQTLNIPAAIFSTYPENMDEEIQKFFIKNKTSPMQGIRETLKAIKAAADCSDKKNLLKKNPPKTLHNGYPLRPLKVLDEAQSKSILKTAGINVPKGIIVKSNDILNSQANIKFPVALKMVGNKMVHKTEHGAVVLDITSQIELEVKAEKMLDFITQGNKELTTDTFLVEEMSKKPIAELLIGITRDEQFGISILIGSGGIHTEILNDNILLLLPTKKEEITNAIRKLRLWPLLNGFRGGKKVSIDNLSRQIMKIIKLFERSDASLNSLEINPLFVYENSVCAVDALIEKVT